MQKERGVDVISLHTAPTSSLGYGAGGQTVPLQDLGLLLPFLEDDPKFSGVTYSRFPLPWLI